MSSQPLSDLPLSFMRWPRISIVTPSYNQGKYIERTVRSVLFQQYPNLDYVVMDGGSTDDTMSRLEPYKDQFSFFTSEPDGGQADAISKGFERSSGEIMAYLNSDDLLAPGTLHFVATFFARNPDVDFIYSHRCTIDENDQVIWYWILPPHHNSLMKRWDFIPQETCFWRRSLFRKAGNVDPSYHFAMDYDLFVRFMNVGRVRRINRFFGAFRQHSESKTTQILGLGRREMLKVRQKYGISRLPRDGFFGMILSQWISRAGHRFAWSGRRLPGALSGAGYDYNDFWGGLLQGEQDEETRPKGFKESPFDPICPVSLGFPERLLFSITCAGAPGVVLTSDIYIQDACGTAIILPSLTTHWREKESKILDNRMIGVRKADGPDSDLDRPADFIENMGHLTLNTDRRGIQAADLILGLTRGLISDCDEVAFLEVGCYNGEVLDALKAKTKWKLAGVERCAYAAKKAIFKGHEVFEATLAEALSIPKKAQSYDVVYLGHGIERFDQPRVDLRRLALLLKPGGFLILRTPNLDSEQLKMFGPAWAHWKPEAHRYIYSKRSLKRILALTGFDLIKLWTLSYPNSTPCQRSKDSDQGVLDLDKNLELQSRNKKELDEMAHAPRRDKRGKGDVIFAISKRGS